MMIHIAPALQKKLMRDSRKKNKKSIGAVIALHRSNSLKYEQLIESIWRTREFPTSKAMKRKDRTMTITTKFNTGDIVWRMDTNKPVCQIITHISISASSGYGDMQGSTKIYYFFNGNIGICEEEVFATKEELLKSL
jgi:hypothetical protein